MFELGIKRRIKGRDTKLFVVSPKRAKENPNVRVAVQSRFFAAERAVPWIEAGVGVIAWLRPL